MPGKKLLVADDSLTIQKVIRLALSNEGYDIQAVSDGNEAIQQISLFRPDVVLIDVSLPGQTAFEVKRAVNLQQDLHETRFILMSSAFEKFSEEHEAEVRFDGRLTKPFDPAHLRQVLKGVLAQDASKAPSAFPPSPPASSSSDFPTDFEESSNYRSPHGEPATFAEDIPTMRPPAPRAPEPWESEPRATESWAPEAWQSEPRASESRAPDQWQSEPRTAESRTAPGPWQSESRPSDPRSPETWQSELRAPDPRPLEVRAPDPRTSEFRTPEAANNPPPPRNTPAAPRGLPPIPSRPSTLQGSGPPPLPSSSQDWEEDLAPIQPASLPPLPPVEAAPASNSLWDEDATQSTSETSDIRELTESTIRMSGLDDFQWSVNETAKRPAFADELPPPGPALDLDPPGGHDHLQSGTASDQLSRDDAFLRPPAHMADLGDSNFISRGQSATQTPNSPPPPPSPRAAPSRPTSQLPNSNASYGSGSSGPHPSEDLPEFTPPPPQPMHSDSDEEAVVPLTTRQMEELMQRQFQETFERMAKKMLPEIAERLIKQEIRRMLEDQS